MPTHDAANPSTQDERETSGLPLPSGKGAIPDPVLRTARVVREVLLEAFPDRLLLERQCKRAAMLLDIALREQGFRTSLAAGYVVGPGGIPGMRTATSGWWCA